MNEKNDFALMRFLRRAGLERLAWSLRRLNCPVDPDALVLEVGSGGNPYPRANVLLDAYENTRERHWVPLVADRPTVLGFVERLPFRDKSFDFVIASHVFEHSPDPRRFLSELQRVSKAGYIETPDAFMERLNPYRDHRLEVTERDGRLIVRKKEAWNTDLELTELYEHRAKKRIAGAGIPSHPFDFHLRYFWSGGIDFKIVNEGCNSAWTAPPSERSPDAVLSRGALRNILLKTMRSALSQRRRNRMIQLLPLLRCPRCATTDLLDRGGRLECPACGASYPVRNNIPIMYHDGASQ